MLYSNNNSCPSNLKDATIIDGMNYYLYSNN